MLQPSLGWTIVAFVGLAGAVALPFYSIAAVSDFSSHQPLSSHAFTSPGFREMSPAQAVEVTRKSFAETVRRLSQLHDEQKIYKQKLAAVRDDLAVLPLRATRAREKLESLSEQTLLLKTELAKSKEELERCRSSIPERKSAVFKEASEFRERYFRSTVWQIQEARQERDKLRKQLGAFPSTQDEILRERERTREAQRIADERFAANLTMEFNHIEQTIESFRQRVLSLADALATQQAALAEAEDELHSATEAIALCRVRIDTLSEYLTTLCRQITQLETNKPRLERDITEAEARLQTHKRLLNEQRAAEKREAENTLAMNDTQKDAVSAPQTSLSSLVSPMSPTPTPSYSVRSLPTYRYYDPAYRPKVGSHFVRGYLRKDGTYVQGHRRTNSDRSFFNNWSSSGNLNPYTGTVGNRRPR